MGFVTHQVGELPKYGNKTVLEQQGLCKRPAVQTCSAWLQAWSIPYSCGTQNSQFPNPIPSPCCSHMMQMSVPSFPSPPLSSWIELSQRLWLNYFVYKAPGALCGSWSLLLVTGNVSFLLFSFLLWILDFVIIYVFTSFIPFFFLPGFPFVCLVMLWCIGIYRSAVFVPAQVTCKMQKTDTSLHIPRFPGRLINSFLPCQLFFS